MKVTRMPPTTDLRLAYERPWQEWPGWVPIGIVVWSLLILDIIL